MAAPAASVRACAPPVPGPGTLRRAARSDLASRLGARLRRPRPPARSGLLGSCSGRAGGGCVRPACLLRLAPQTHSGGHPASRDPQPGTWGGWTPSLKVQRTPGVPPPLTPLPALKAAGPPETPPHPHPHPHSEGRGAPSSCALRGRPAFRGTDPPRSRPRGSSALRRLRGAVGAQRRPPARPGTHRTAARAPGGGASTGLEGGEPAAGPPGL